jgi:hypothetical protein
MEDTLLSTKALLEKAHSIAADAETRAEAASKQVHKLIPNTFPFYTNFRSKFHLPKTHLQKENHNIYLILFSPGRDFTK